MRSQPLYSARRRAVAWSLVLAQLMLLAGLPWLPGAPTWPVSRWITAPAVVGIAAAGPVAVAGLTASPLPTAQAELRTTGVWAWVRHPVYSANRGGDVGHGQPPWRLSA